MPEGPAPESDSERKVRGALRFDLLIGLAALLLSAVVAAAAVYQTHVIANQLSATVWPYLSFTTHESDTAFSYDLRNDGLGPAIVRAASLSLDGKTMKSVRAMGFAVLPPPKHSSMSTSSFGDGDVIRPSETLELLRFTGAGARVLAAAAQRRIAITVCYCSLLDQCWTLTSGASVSRPHQIARCEEQPGFGA